MGMKKGDSFRLKVGVRTVDGWNGYGIVTEDQITGTIRFRKSGDDPEDLIAGACFCRESEIVKIEASP